MTIKKLTTITVAGAVLLAGAIGISIKLTQPSEMEMEVVEQNSGTETMEENGPQTLENMENTPLYYDDKDVLLLPLRNVMEGLGGSVSWNAEEKKTEISYRDKKLLLATGETAAVLNGYDITLPAPAEMINGCLYVEESVISAYYTGDVIWNKENGQIILQTKDPATPVMAVRMLTGEKDGRSYEIEAPVIVGLNDVNFEKNLNAGILEEMQKTGESFLQKSAEVQNPDETEPAAEVREEQAMLQLKANIGFSAQSFLSLWWEGTADGASVKFAKNIDLVGQKAVVLTDLLQAESLEEVKTAAGAGWTEDRFYLSEEGALVLLKGSDTNSLEMHHWTTEGKPLQWQDAYKEVLKKNG